MGGSRESNVARLPVPPAAAKLERARKSGALTEFNPKHTRMKLGALKEGVKLAAKIKDWEALEDAIDAVIEEQRAFVAWWEGNVTPGKTSGVGRVGLIPRHRLRFALYHMRQAAAQSIILLPFARWQSTNASAMPKTAARPNPLY